MYNNIEIHNTYHIRLIDSRTNKVKLDEIYNNSSNSTVYLQLVRNNSINTLSLSADWTIGEGDDIQEGSSNLATLSFTKIDKENDDFGQSMAFESNTFVSGPIGHELTYIKFNLGGPVLINNQYEFLSTVSQTIDREAYDILTIDVTLHITIAKPTHYLKFFDASHSILMHKGTDTFPTPVPSNISYCPIPFSFFENLNELAYNVPTFDGIFFNTTYNNGEATLHNGDGYTYDFDKFNIGLVDTLLIGGVGVGKIGATTVLNNVKNYKILNILDYYDSNNHTWLTYNDDDYVYFFYKAPEGCTLDNFQLLINNSGGNAVANANITYVEPQSSIVVSGMTYADNTGNTYSVKALSNELWTPTDLSIAPTQIVLDENDYFFWTGNGFTCSIDGTVLPNYCIKKINNKIINITNQPKINDKTYRFSALESTVISERIFDKDIIRLTNSISNMGGFKISKTSLVDYNENVINGVLVGTLNVSTTGFFKCYRSKNTFKVNLSITSG